MGAYSNYTVNIVFKGISCKIKIVSYPGEEYRVLVKSNMRMSDQDLQALHEYMKAEGFYFGSQELELE